MLGLITPLSTKFFSVLFGILSLLGLQFESKQVNPQNVSISQHKEAATQEVEFAKLSLSSPEANTTINKTPSVPEEVQSSEKEEPPRHTPPTVQEPAKEPEDSTINPDNEPSTQAVVPFTPSILDSKVRAALVNILCTSDGSLLRPISGTGILIDESGIILTNAHIGQYFLLKDYPEKDFLRCIARTGSPAVPAYTLELIYIPEQWVKDNSPQLLAQTPLGTGENDFALLKITGSARKNEIAPDIFPHLEPNTDRSSLSIGKNIEIGAYPADFLGGQSIQQNLYITTTIAAIADYFTFATSTIDLLSLGGNILAQRGASGGAVTDLDGKLVGLIVTTTEGKTTDERDLHAITIGHIDDKLRIYTGKSLEGVLSGNLGELEVWFRNTLRPGLVELLSAEIKKRSI